MNRIKKALKALFTPAEPWISDCCGAPVIFQEADIEFGFSRKVAIRRYCPQCLQQTTPVRPFVPKPINETRGKKK